MTSEASVSQPGTQFVLTKGTEVEFSSDEDGFKGSWYTVKILETPSRSKKKKQSLLLVQYKTLFSEDQITPLEEYADPHRIRPLPPEHHYWNRVFEENDVVDADCRDGWWVGVVRKVLEGPKYLVYFDLPPDVMEFCGKDLRPHWDWDGENWIKAQKQQTMGSIYTSGTSVEVNIEDKSASGVWFPAIVVKEYGDDTFYVKYQSPKNGDVEVGTMFTVVASTDIRPVPPHYVVSDYELLETVDMRYESGWRPGIIKKVLAGRRYVISLNRENESKELDHSELRPHVDWVDGKWIGKSEKALVVSDKGEQLQGGLNGIANKAGAVKDNSGGKTLSSKDIKNLMVKSAIGDEKLSSYTLPISHKKTELAADGNAQSNPPENLTRGNSAQPAASAVEPLLNETLSNLGAGAASRRSRGNSVQSPSSAVEPSADETLSDLSAARRRLSISKKIEHIDQNSFITRTLTARKRARTKRLKRVEMESENLEMMAKKGRHTKLPSKSPESLVTVKVKKAVDAANQDINKNVDDQVTGEKTSEVSEKDHERKETDMAMIGVSKDVVDDENRPLSMWLGGTQSSKNGFPCSKSASGWGNAKEKQTDLVAKGEVMPQQNQCLPFTKKSPAWKTLQSMELFKLVPQNPHFDPLTEQKEDFREGMAIGFMVTLVGLFEKIASLEFDSSRSQFERIVESLLDLEKHGFDVTLPLNRVNELLSIKDRQGELLNVFQCAEKDLRELSDERKELIEKINAIEKKISKLKEELAAAESQMQPKKLQISTLQSNVDAMNMIIDKARRDFGKVATAPWIIS